MLSELLRFEVTDGGKNGARLTDLSVALLDADYPSVTRLFFRNRENKILQLDWRGVRALDLKKRKIIVENLEAAEECVPEEITGDVLLRHDVLDALILDLLNRRTTRANDLLLESQDDGTLCLRAVDAGFGAMLRRVSFGLYTRVNKDQFYDWQYVEFLRGDPAGVENGAGYRLRITRLPDGEIAQLANYVPYLHAAELLTLLPDPQAADVLEALPIERQVQIIEELSEREAAKMFELMAPNLAADLMARLHTPTMKRFLEMLPKKKSERIIELLRYPEDTVGGVMMNDMVYVRVDLTVAEAREKLREPLKEPDFVALVFVVDDEESRRLRGVISLRQLLTEDDDRRLDEVMHPFVESLNPYDAAIAAAYRLVGTQLYAMPVTIKEGKLIGVMTIDAAIPLITPATSGMQGVRIFS
ncbi:MAG TPA: CBS domain-containing protein [Pyrinomonadaceae bacterium]|jgi:CBS domain-containing protein